ncbi:MAG: ActS/PrrB/RegB family redox-sensitive histidine kinase [Hyphomicrobiaceae bacterium]
MADTAFEATTSRLRLQTIARLRWIAVIGQSTTLLGTYFLANFYLPLTWCLAVVGMSVVVNLFLQLRYPARHRLSVKFATILLIYDVVQLALLLYLTGGLENPFSFLLVAPVTVSAATLPTESTLTISVASLVASALLVRYHEPLPWHPGVTFELPLLYRLGMWFSILCSLMFMGLYSRRLAREARQMSEALAATELVLAREQQLHALDGLAAAAAHELGTPLATITVVASELAREVDPKTPIGEDIALLKSQAQRCREILTTLTTRSEEGDPLHKHLPVSHLIEEAIEPFLVFDKLIDFRARPAKGVSGPAIEEPVGQRKPGILHSLTNIVENAVDFAQDSVDILAEWDEDRVTIVISDDGPGFPPHLIGAIGDPYVTTRPLAQRTNGGKREGGGLGLGFFIAKTLLERSGAQISLANRPEPMTGAMVRISWPRKSFEDRPDVGDDMATAAALS